MDQIKRPACQRSGEGNVFSRVCLSNGYIRPPSAHDRLDLIMQGPHTPDMFKLVQLGPRCTVGRVVGRHPTGMLSCWVNLHGVRELICD